MKFTEAIEKLLSNEEGNCIVSSTGWTEDYIRCFNGVFYWVKPMNKHETVTLRSGILMRTDWEIVPVSSLNERNMYRSIKEAVENLRYILDTFEKQVLKK